MKPLVRVLATCCAAIVMPAWSADPPANTAGPATVPATAAPAAIVAETPPATTTPAAEPAGQVDNAATAAAHPGGPQTEAAAAKPSAPVWEDKTLTSNEVKQLLAQGYRPLNRDGQIYYCRRETVLGSHFETLNCRTGEQAKARARDGQDMTSKLQRSGGCRADGPSC
jgi:hypothetical protein